MSLPSTYTSKKHCKIECKANGQIILHDTSTNGTFVNDQNYSHQMIELRDQDRIGKSSYLLGDSV